MRGTRRHTRILVDTITTQSSVRSARGADVVELADISKTLTDNSFIEGDDRIIDLW